MEPNMISTCLVLIGLLHPLVYIASAEGQYGPLQPPQCGYSDVSHAEVHNAVPAKRGAWPWTVALGFESELFSKLIWLCEGTLISSRHVLTSGVCILFPSLKVARIGALNLDGDEDGVQPIDIEIEKIIMHPELNSTGFQNDIAVLKLAKEVPFSDRVRPICLPLANDFENKNLSGSYAVGWKRLPDDPRSPVLMEVQVRVVSNEICRKLYSSLEGFKADRRVLCIETINPEELQCKGSSGSPLMLSQGSAFYEVGFHSHGAVFNRLPCVYTRVDAYMDFIASALK